ncbi:MAG: CBS and ACT domain-containing protein [Pseudodesulfovibrio sp.]
MLVRDWMTVNVLSLGVNSSVMDAAEILHEKSIRQFPVLDRNGKLVGIVSDRDIRDAMPSKFIPSDNISEKGGGLYTLTAGDIMTMDPISVTSDTAMDAVAEILVKHRIGGLPVLDGEELKGIITQADVLRFLCAASGSMRGGTQFGIRLPARPGPLSDLLIDFKEMGIVFDSVFTAHDHNEAGSRNAYIRIEDMGDKSLEQVLEALQQKFEILFYVNEGITVDIS